MKFKKIKESLKKLKETLKKIKKLKQLEALGGKRRRTGDRAEAERQFVRRLRRGRPGRASLRRVRQVRPHRGGV